VDFLRHALAPQAPLFVRGAHLCDWAEAFYTGRQHPVQDAISPGTELRALCPGLSLTQTQAIYERLKSGFAAIERPLSIQGLMDALFPSPLWRQIPSRQHAADFLLWMVATKPDDWTEPLLATQVRLWQAQSLGGESVAYSVWNVEGAQALLDRWLGIVKDAPVAELGEFPVDIPSELKERVRSVWRREIIETQGACLTQIDRMPIPSALKQIAAKEAVDYYKLHPDRLDEQRIVALSKYISSNEQNDLRKRRPPAVPSPLPSTIEGVLKWFQNEYLPYRLWQSTNKGAAAEAPVEDAAMQFALWYLAEYPKALMGGSLRNYLSFIRTAALSTPDHSAATLLIVLDGLHVADAQYLQLALQKRTSRLAPLVDSLAFTALPTITQFCKDALLKGVPPAQTAQVEPIGVILPENESPVQRLVAAQRGRLYLWRVMEPDRTYHKRNTYDTLRREVEAQLEGIAVKIADIVEQVPAEIPLRIAVTTDHGRLLARSIRNMAAPDDMAVHGRTAWGRGNRAYPAAGYVIEDNLVFLHGERFGLLEDTAIILSEDAFHTADGKTGSEIFPHGGLYPEEVIIPWLIYARDAAKPQVEVEVSGRGQAGKSGQLTIRITNLGTITATVNQMHLANEHGLAHSILLDWQVAPSSAETRTRTLEPWPSSAAAKSLSATVSIQMANGLTFEIDAHVDIQSEEMYHRDNILEGLDL